MRIGLVTSSYPTSPDDTTNAGVFVRELALELASRGHEVHVITPRKPEPVIPDSPLNLHVIAWPARERDLASASLRNPLTALRYAILVARGVGGVPAYAHQQRLDALLALWAIPSGLFAWQTLKRWGIPYGVWALGSDIWGRRKYPFGESVVRQVLRDAVFCFADGVRLARDAVAIAGRDCEFLPSARRLSATNSPPVELEPGATHFLFIGRYERNKGPDILVEAMRLLLDGGVDAYLHMFGGGSLRTSLRRRIEGYENRIRLGDFADAVTATAYLRACDWLVIPSRIESIPLVFVDALHMGIPVVAAAVGDLDLLVAQYDVGVAVQPEDPVALASAMRQAIAFPRSAYAPALVRASEDFDLVRSATRCADSLVAATERQA
jgi:glycosyltransferase involved in cell wall biosynthesis